MPVRDEAEVGLFRPSFRLPFLDDEDATGKYRQDSHQGRKEFGTEPVAHPHFRKEHRGDKVDASDGDGDNSGYKVHGHVSTSCVRAETVGDT